MNKVDNKQQEKSSSQLKIEMTNHLNSTFNQYLSGFEEKDELYLFMADEKNMYQENGQPTDAYREWMEKVNNYLHQIAIKDVLGETSDANDLRKDVFNCMGNYLQLKEELMHSIENEKKKAGFNVLEWVRNVLAREGKTRDEISQDIEDFKELTDKILRKDGQDND